MSEVHEFESHADLLRKNLRNDRLNDVAISCKDKEIVHCQSYMLRICSDVFNEMLGSSDLHMKLTPLGAPRFTSTIMERVKFFCHTGEIICLPDTEINPEEVGIIMEVIVAADYYNIGALGSKCLEYVKAMLNAVPNMAFVVVNQFGINHADESRTIVASAICYSRGKLAMFNKELLDDPTVNVIGDIANTELLQEIFNEIPMTGIEQDAVKIGFMEKWVALSSISNAASLAKEILANSQLLKEIATINPRYLTDPKGILRSSNLIDSADLMEAIYSVPPSWVWEKNLPTPEPLNPRRYSSVSDDSYKHRGSRKRGRTQRR